MMGPGKHGEATGGGSPSEAPEPQRSMVTSRGRALPPPDDFRPGCPALPAV